MAKFPVWKPHLSPVQILMGRRTKSKLPISDKLLATTFAANVKQALQKSKDRQSAWYSQHAKERRRKLENAQTVRIKFHPREDQWRKGEITNFCPIALSKYVSTTAWSNDAPRNTYIYHRNYSLSFTMKMTCICQNRWKEYRTVRVFRTIHSRATPVNLRVRFIASEGIIIWFDSGVI